MSDERLKLVYDEAQRGLVQQATSLDEVRARAGAILAAASIAAGFLAPDAVKGTSPLPTGTIVGIAAFVVVGLCTAYILLPRDDWKFSNSAAEMIGTHIETNTPSSIDKMLRELALNFEVSRDENARKLVPLMNALVVACVLLITEIIAFITAIGGRH